MSIRLGGFSGRLAVLALATVLVTPAAAQLFANRRPDRPVVTLPDGPVRAVILKSCTQCHGIDEYGYYAMDRASWLAVIERMKVTPSGVVEGAVISDADRELLLDWLVATFGPNTEPFPRQYVIPELGDDELLADADAEALLEAACGACHSSLTAVTGTSLDANQWRATLTGKIATGAPLLIADTEPLVQWLAGRRRGRSQ